MIFVVKLFVISVLFQIAFSNVENSKDQKCEFSRDCPPCHTNGTTRTNKVFSSPDILVVQRVLQQLPILESTEDTSLACRHQLNIYHNDLNQLKLYALKMHDSSAKLPSGLLNGNVNQYGDFDQCLKVCGDEFNGKYCLTSLQILIRPGASPSLEAIHRHMLSNYIFKSDLDDPGHRVPRFSSIHWGLCLPEGCNGRDIESMIRKQLGVALSGISVELDVRVPEHMCQVNKRQKMQNGTMITGALFSALLLIVITATIRHYCRPEDISKTWECFSIKHNLKKLTNHNQSPDDIGCVHGIRILNSLLLILAHKSMAAMYLPYSNRTKMSEDASQPWAVTSRAASLYTDPFLMLSGLLTTNALLRKAQKHGNFSMTTEYLSRLFRIIPPFAALILFCTWIMPFIDSGPMWNQVVTHHSDICKKYWWRNVLFIHNYFSFQNMCLTHTHHIGIDMQLFLVTPPIVILLIKRPPIMIRVLLFLTIFSTAARYCVARAYSLSNYVAYGTSVKQLFATADYMYTLPPYRASVYIMGILLAYLLHNPKIIVLSKTKLRLGWAAACALLCVSFAGTVQMGGKDYRYDANQAANYAAFAPVTWCAFFAWAIYVSQLGYHNWITKLLSWNKFAIWTKISYSVYLTQFPVFFYYVGITRTPLYYSLLEQLFNWKEFFYIAVSSLMLTLLVEMPSQNLKNLMFRSYDSYNKDTKLKRKIIESIKNEIYYSKAVAIVEKYRHKDDQKVK